MVLRQFLSRTLTMIGTLFVVSILVFVIVQLPEGDIIESIVGEYAAQGALTRDQIEILRRDYGLDQPYVVRYFNWVGGLVTGDMGIALSRNNQPVAQVLGERMTMTIVLNIAVVLFIWVVSFPIAMISAVRQYSWTDHGLTFVGFIGLAIPNFLMALVLYFFAYTWFGLQVGGLMDPQYEDQPWTAEKLGNVLAHLIVPVIVIGTSGTAAMIRRLRANLLDELDRAYVTTARAKGLAPTRILIRYPLRLSLTPFIAEIGNLLPQLVSGAAVVSVVMSLPTVGGLLVDSLRAQDTFLSGAILMFLALLTIVGIWLSDLALVLLDPRIRLGATEAAR